MRAVGMAQNYLGGGFKLPDKDWTLDTKMTQNGHGKNRMLETPKQRRHFDGC